MILGCASKMDWPPLTIQGTPLERASVYKLLGVFISADLRWKTHIEYITSKAVSRLYFLKQLKRAGLSSSHLLHYYTTVIRPVLEYTSLLWHPTLTKSQTGRLEAVQRRAINIIFCYSFSTPYLSTLALADISSLYARRVDLSKCFTETFVHLTIVYTTFSHPLRLSHPGSGSLLYTQGRTSKLKDIAQQSLTHFYISVATNLEFILYFVCFRLYHVLLSFIMCTVFCLSLIHI